MNQEIERLLRDNIRRLEPYSCARDEFKGTARVMLDANENPFNAPINRYPDPLQWQVKTELAKVKGIGADHIFLGVGSDECIDICYRVFCEPRIDNVVAMAPSYGMYEVCADINDVNYRKVPLNADFSLDTDAMLAFSRCTCGYTGSLRFIFLILVFLFGCTGVSVAACKVFS